MAASLQFLEQVDFLVCQGPIVASRDELAHRDDDQRFQVQYVGPIQQRKSTFQSGLDVHNQGAGL